VSVVDQVDCLIVGAGPAGMMAAVLLTRARREVVVLDSGHSRARWIPRTRNCPGYPTGISGEYLLHRLRRQLRNHKVRIRDARVLSLAHDGDAFEVSTEARSWRSRTVVAATGVVDVLPRWEGIDDGIRAGVVRLCAVCDGYEVVGRNIAVFGRVEDCIPHACYLRKHSTRVTAIHPPQLRCSDADLALAA
jgi:thioredoxin reductase (NADPH)